MGSIALKNYAYKFENEELEATASFVEVFRNDEMSMRIIVKKTSFCWLLRGDHVRLSSDRLKRVKADMNMKSKMYDSLSKIQMKRLNKKTHQKRKM